LFAEIQSFANNFE